MNFRIFKPADTILSGPEFFSFSYMSYDVWNMQMPGKLFSMSVFSQMFDFLLEIYLAFLIKLSSFKLQFKRRLLSKTTDL